MCVSGLEVSICTSSKIALYIQEVPVFITVILAEFDPLPSKAVKPTFKEPPPQQSTESVPASSSFLQYRKTARKVSPVKHVFCESVYTRIGLPTVGGVTPRLLGGGTATNRLWEVFLRTACHVVRTYG